jgi:hypothetical protein
MDSHRAIVAAIVVVAGVMLLSCVPPDRDSAFAHPADSTFRVTTGQLRDGDSVAVVRAAHVTLEFFAVIDRLPLLGRVFVAAEFTPEARRVVVLTQHLWEQRFGGRPQVIGTPIQIDGSDHVVIGVMPRGIEWPPGIELWMPRTNQPL